MTSITVDMDPTAAFAVGTELTLSRVFFSTSDAFGHFTNNPIEVKQVKLKPHTDPYLLSLDSLEANAHIIQEQGDPFVEANCGSGIRLEWALTGKCG